MACFETISLKQAIYATSKRLGKRVIFKEKTSVFLAIGTTDFF
jgi:hypothetical protein